MERDLGLVTIECDVKHDLISMIVYDKPWYDLYYVNELIENEGGFRKRKRKKGINMLVLRMKFSWRKVCF